MGKIAAVIFAVQLFASAAFAQGSPFNFLGFGEPINTKNSRLEALGGAGFALTDPHIVSDLNPASWSFMNRSRLETGLRHDYVKSVEQDLEGTASNIRFSGFSFGSPFWDNYKASLSLGFYPLTDASATIEQKDTAGTRSYRSQGGVSMGYVGLAAQPSSGIAVGARLEILFGNVRHVSQVAFTDPTAASSIFQRDYAVHGLRGSIGLLFNGDSLSDALKGISLGVSYTPGIDLDMTRRTEITPVNVQLDTTIEATGFGRLAGTIAAGLAVRFEHRYQALLDFQMQDFADAYLYSSASSSTGDPALRNAIRLGLGVERAPNVSQEFGSTTFWGNLGLRLGAAYYQTPFNPAGSGGINELSVSAGIGIPIKFESLLDVSVTAGQRTPTTANGAPKDTFLRVGATLGLSEKWFVPTRREE